MYRFRMKILVFCLLLYSLSVQAATLTPRAYESEKHRNTSQIITNFIFEELLTLAKKETPPTIYKARKKTLNGGKRGRQIIEEMKRKNREKLAKMRGINPDKIKSGKDLVKAQKSDNKNLIEKINLEIKSQKDWKALAKEEIDALKADIIKGWKAKHEKIISDWESKKLRFNSKANKYGETTFTIPLILPVSKKDLQKNIDIEIKKDFFIIPESMSLDIRDQKYRPTCASFAGIRLVETILAQNYKRYDLSEQYFYWASKKKCQFQKCSNKGSWVGNGFLHSKKNRSLDIPLEKSCPYNKFPKSGNETQIPLESSCQKGVVKINNFHYHKSLDEMVKILRQNRPVVVSMKLAPNFYNASALILYRDRNKSTKTDSHAKGHSITIVGYVKLPKILNEGKLCFIAANSWGQGWGRGGYSCISERWLLEQRNRNPFVSISSVEG